MTNHESDKVFSGSIPELYETHLVPLIFEPYAQDLAQRVSSEPVSQVDCPRWVGTSGTYPIGPAFPGSTLRAAHVCWKA